MDVLVVVDIDLGDDAVDARGDLVQVAGDVGVIRFLVGERVVGVEENDNGRDNSGHDHRGFLVAVEQRMELLFRRGRRERRCGQGWRVLFVG